MIRFGMIFGAGYYCGKNDVFAAVNKPYIRASQKEIVVLGKQIMKNDTNKLTIADIFVFNKK